MGIRKAYTKDMKFARALPAPSPRSETAKKVAWIYAAVLVVMVVGQLFSFEKFIPLIAGYWLPGGNGATTLMAGLIVVSEVFALPFLLRMPLSPLMRWFSLGCGLVAAVLWVILGVIAVVSDNAMTNSGILGTKVTVPSGGAQLLWAVVLGVLAVWSAWGLWPADRKK
jgi:hypothetical protein